MKYRADFKAENLTGCLYVEADTYGEAAVKAEQRIRHDRWGEKAKITELTVRHLGPSEAAAIRVGTLEVKKTG